MAVSKNHIYPDFAQHGYQVMRELGCNQEGAKLELAKLKGAIMPDGTEHK